uniref:Coiled-coil domain containing 125 n=1 Tax=Jaculus jaculus TaxID=51337 RepID=A0A8C5KRF5_JACJA
MSKAVRSSSESEVQTSGTEEDDLTEGDLGYGLGRRPGGIYHVDMSHSLTSRKRSDGTSYGPLPFSRKGEERNGTISQSSRDKSLQDTCPQGSRMFSDSRQSSTDSNSELSTEQLKQRLHETLEEVEILKTELEAAQRQLEGKEEALRILQSMAVLGKATSHTQAVLQKTIEQKKSLEKLNRRCLEALAVLDVKQQKMARERTGRDASGLAEVSGLELAVFGACLCRGPGGNPCSCARMAASARKLVLQLKHELELLQKSKEEAYMMADAFRIAFEQQLMRKNDHVLRLTQMDKMCRKAPRLSGKLLTEDGTPSPRSKKTLAQKLLGILPSELISKGAEDQNHSQEVFKMLIDMLNDKEEALAHQRKVSYMLARALENTDITSKQQTEKHPTEEDFLLKTPWHRTSELSLLGDPTHSGVQICNHGGCFCSGQHPQRAPDYSRTHKRSHSLPSSLCRE